MRYLHPRRLHRDIPLSWRLTSLYVAILAAVLAVLGEVADDGAGIDPADLPHLFARFYRGDKARARRADGGGNGLGLSIAGAIVEAHGGVIAVASALERGTTFIIEIPAHQAGQVGIDPRLVVSAAGTAVAPLDAAGLSRGVPG